MTWQLTDDLGNQIRAYPNRAQAMFAWADLPHPEMAQVIDPNGETVLPAMPNATTRVGEDGKAIVELATCGECGRMWNDAAVSSVTPAPSGRCPFEYEHKVTS